MTTTTGYIDIINDINLPFSLEETKPLSVVQAIPPLAETEFTVNLILGDYAVYKIKYGGKAIARVWIASNSLIYAIKNYDKNYRVVAIMVDYTEEGTLLITQNPHREKKIHYVYPLLASGAFLPPLASKQKPEPVVEVDKDEEVVEKPVEKPAVSIAEVTVQVDKH